MKIVAKKTIQAQSTVNSKYYVELRPSVQFPKEWNGSSGRFVDTENEQKIVIGFDIDIDARHWGIKEILVIVGSSDVSFSFDVRDTQVSPEKDEVYSKTIQFDPSKIPVQMSAGSSITITDLTLTLNSDFTVDYGKSYFEATTLVG
jgi:hypothetical protein